MWKKLRITLLLVVLAVVALQAWLDRITTTDWDSTLWVGVFPIPADNSAATRDYIASLTRQDFSSIESFFTVEAQHYGVPLEQPVRIELYPPSDKMPPLLEPGAGMLASAWWSLKLRWFARSAADVPGRVPSQIRVFVLFHDPAMNQKLPHSHGLQKGLVGVVHAFADRAHREMNNVVIAHEVLHTLGATDKYDPFTDAPVYPHGFADPDREPLFPQEHAEIMAGRIAISEEHHEMPRGLHDAVVGALTATEIGWKRP
ncbi:MAG TPA: hypothetical protein VIL32_10430 [Steroidobacteraceae bacterium]